MRSISRVQSLSDNNDLHVMHIGVNDMCHHVDQRRHMNWPMETDVGDVLQFGTMFAVENDLYINMGILLN